MQPSTEYQRFAEECRRLAQIAQTERHRKILEEMAEDWMRRAEENARKGSRERPAAERHTLGADEPQRYAYDPSGVARALARPLSNDRDDHSPKTALEEGITGGHPVDRDAAASFQTAHSSSGRHPPPTAERRDEIMSDHDLKRLEASLRWLQRQEVATRLPRATPLPPVPGAAPVDATGRRHSSEMLVESLRAPRSQEPERLAPPLAMRSRSDNLRWPLGIVVSSSVSVAFGYGRPVYASAGHNGPTAGCIYSRIGGPPYRAVPTTE